MKGFYITLITIMSILILALLSLLGFAIYNGGDFMAFGPVERTEENIRKDEQFALKDIETLDISFVSSDVYVYTTTDEELRVIQYANKDLKQKRLYQSKAYNHTLSIKDNEVKIHFGFFMNTNMVYEIFIPESYCDKINMKTVSGDIMIEGNLCSNIMLQSTSGDIKNTHSLENDATLQTVSGNINLQSIKGHTTLKTTSGDVKVNTAEGDFNIRTVSGEAIVNSLIGSGDITTTSGDIKVTHFELQNDSKIKTVSGDVDLTLINTNCEIRTKTTSGDVHLPNGSSLVGSSPEHLLEIKTTSGDITIE